MGKNLRFGPTYLIPRPFDPRLIEQVAPAVAAAAMASGVASRPIADLKTYRQRLHNHVFRTGMIMKPVFEQARESVKRIAYAEGEDDQVLEAAQQAVEEGIARPLLIGRRRVIEERIAELGLGMRPGSDVDLLDPHENPRYEAHCAAFYGRVMRRGYTPAESKQAIRNNTTSLAATLLRTGEADAMICGLVGRFRRHLERVHMIVGTAPGVRRLTSMTGLVLRCGTLFIADAHVQQDPDAEALAEITALCAQEVRCFGIEPKVALLSHSNFGSDDAPSARKMRDALSLIRRQQPELEIEGEMRADLALSEVIRQERFPDSLLNGQANLLIMPNQDAANIAFNMLKILGEGMVIGPILLGAAHSAHIVTPGVTVRGLLNITALAAVRT